MPNALPPFRADQVGSLLRPPRLLEARRAAAAGTLAPEVLRKLEDEAISEVVAKQEAVGLSSATDGEYRRASFYGDFVSKVRGTASGIGPTAHTMWFDTDGKPRAGGTPRASMGVNDRLGLEEVIFGDDFAYLAACCTTATPKICIPSPSMIHYRGGDAAIDRTTYPDLDVFWDDVVEIWTEELRGLAALGCRYLQLDDTSLAFLLDPREQEDLAARGNDPATQHAFYVGIINRVLANRPEGMRITLHTCRGNMESAWSTSGAYDAIAESVFGALEVDGFFLEFDDERSGSFAPLRYVPEGRYVVLGLVSSKTPVLEDPELLKRRVEEAAQHLSLDQLCLSTQCGFASTEGGNKLAEDEQFAKLRLVIDTAEDIWG